MSRLSLRGKRKKLPAAEENSSSTSYSDDPADIPVKKYKAMQVPLGGNVDDNDGVSTNFADDGHSPYYAKNFQFVLDTVMNDELNEGLFLEDEISTLAAFSKLSDGARFLYIRLFTRKFRWLPQSKINYPRIADDLTDLLEELVKACFIEDGSKINDLETWLSMMNAAGLKKIGNTLRVNTSRGMTETIKAIMKHSRAPTVASMMLGSKPQAARIVSMCRNEVGSCYKLTDVPRQLFFRVMLLFAPQDTLAEQETNRSGVQTPLQKIMLANSNRSLYPKYTVRRKTRMFPSRDHVLRFCSALQLEYEISASLESKDWDETDSLVKRAREQYNALLSERRYLDEIPSFLRSFTELGPLKRSLYVAVEFYQRRKRHAEAVNLLRSLLDSWITGCMSKGRLFQRLALNLELHLKKPLEAVAAAVEGLCDAEVFGGPQLELYQRIIRLADKKHVSFEQLELARSNVSVNIKEAPTLEIQAELISGNGPGSGTNWIYQNTDDHVSVCGVEQLAMLHYKSLHGFTQGLHSEGSSLFSLFSLLMYDVLFSSEVDDVFISAQQTGPLDLHSDEFYKNRFANIDSRLDVIQGMSRQELEAEVRSLWSCHFGESIVGMNWELFANEKDMASLARCIGGSKLSQILKRFAQRPRHWRSGVPDLTLWNSSCTMHDTNESEANGKEEEGSESESAEQKASRTLTSETLNETCSCKVMLVEVKGPGDRLSAKQQLWLDFLGRCDIPVQVCRVSALSRKQAKFQKRL